ncbi:hypothetical protein KI387_002300, partial [Taxus chinensis]
RSRRMGDQRLGVPTQLQWWGRRRTCSEGKWSPRVPVDNAMHVFDLDQSSWSVAESKGTAPPPRVGVTMTSIGSIVYIFGGRDKDHQELNHFYSFDTPLRGMDAHFFRRRRPAAPELPCNGGGRQTGLRIWRLRPKRAAERSVGVQRRGGEMAGLTGEQQAASQGRTGACGHRQQGLGCVRFRRHARALGRAPFRPHDRSVGR